MATMDFYLIIINIIGIFAYLINMYLYSHTASWNIDSAVTVISFLGGAAGIIMIVLLFDRKVTKENMMSRVYVICSFVIQFVIYLAVKGVHSDHFTIAFWRFFSDHKVFLFYVVVINIVAFAAYAIDKAAAIDKRPRITIATLLSLAFAGGSIGSISAMYLLHHKTRKDYFSVGVPLIICMQVVVLFYVMNIR